MVRILQLLPLLLLSTGHCAKRSTRYFSSSFPYPCKVSIPSPNTKRRLRQVHWLAQDYTAGKWVKGECEPSSSCFHCALKCRWDRLWLSLLRFWGNQSPLDSSLVVSKKKRMKLLLSFRPSKICKPCALSAPAHRVAWMESVPRGLFPEV